MSTVSRDLPGNPHFDVPKRQARELQQQCKQRVFDAFERVRRQHPRFRGGAGDAADMASVEGGSYAGTADNDDAIAGIKLSDAQFVIAREYGFSSWKQLKRRIDGNTIARLIDEAIRAGDAGEVTRLLTANPELLHVPVRSGNWGPPMSHAANMGRFEMVKTIAALGARDIQHALGRALLHGDIEIAKWLHGHGAVLDRGIIMGCCETLNERGFGFLDEMGVDMTDEKGDRLSPLAMVLETYSRNPEGKHAIMRRFKARGYAWADSAIMAFHCGDLDGLRRHLQRDPQLLSRRFSYREIYPPALGCADDGRSGLHGTPIDGSTLLHLSIDFDEKEIFDWLLEEGANVNAAAIVDKEGFGGHTPLYNAIVSDAYVNGLQRDAYMIRRLLDSGADIHVKVNLRKFLDWRDEPGWHIARDVTPLEWAADFPEKGWINQEGVNLLVALSG